MAEADVPIPQKHHLKEKASEEIKSFTGIFLYLWVVFGLLSLHKTLVLSQHHLNYEEHAFAIINALIFAKVVLIGDYFHLGARFDRKPLIYPILYNSLIFTVFLICFHIAESVLVGMWHGNTMADSLPPMFLAGPRGILSVGIMGFIVLFPFFGFREVAGVIGHKEMRALLLERGRGDPQPRPGRL
ncbi:MAG: hypothetical protein WBX19_04320 [Terracidiphilus sp.]